MIENPLVSVIMPAFNAELTIEESIQSIILQSYENWELIIVNDGSTDNTANIIDDFSRKDNRIKSIHLVENSGIVTARNTGISKSKGKFIANLDSDDLAKPNRLTIQVGFMEKNPGFVLLGSACDLIDDDGQLIEIIKRDIPSNHLKSLLVFSNYFINSSVIMKAEVVKEIKYSTDIQLAEDYNLFTKLATKGEIGNLKESLVQYRSHAHNISKQKNIELKNAELNVQSIELTKLSIHVSKEELEIHGSLVNGPFKSNLQKLSKVESWLLKLIEANDRIAAFDKGTFNYYSAYFFERYCFNSGNGMRALTILNKSILAKSLSNRILFNLKFIAKLFLQNRSK